MAKNWKGNGDFERVGRQKNRFICQWCGKHFTAPTGHARKYCSEECRKSAVRAYNTAFQARKRAERGERSEEQRKHDNAIQKASHARKVWNEWLEVADDIVKLTQNTAKGYDVRNSIAKYLSDNFRRRTKREQAPDFSSIFSANTADKKIIESLGDKS